MRRSLAVAVAVAVGLAFGGGLMVGTLALRGERASAQAQPTEEDRIKAALEKLEKINKKLSDAIADFKAGTITAAQLNARILDIEDLKRKAIDDLFEGVPIYGQSFSYWYTGFHAMDFRLQEARVRSQLADMFSRGDVAKSLTRAENNKKSIEKKLKERLQQIQQPPPPPPQPPPPSPH